jgi:hypothetical protein
MNIHDSKSVVSLTPRSCPSKGRVIDNLPEDSPGACGYCDELLLREKRRSHAELQTTEKEGGPQQIEKGEGHEAISGSTAGRPRALFCSQPVQERIGGSTGQTIIQTWLSQRLVQSQSRLTEEGTNHTERLLMEQAGVTDEICSAIEQGPITKQYFAQPQNVVSSLNRLRSTEITSYLQGNVDNFKRAESQSPFSGRKACEDTIFGKRFEDTQHTV